MDKIYRELLRNTKGKPASEMLLYAANWSYKDAQLPVIEQQKEVLQTEQIQEEVTEQVTDEVTEKIKVLDSLNVFGEEKLKKLDEYEFQGGKILPKPKTDQMTLVKAESFDWNALELKYAEHLDSSWVARKFSRHPDSCKVFFITDDIDTDLSDNDEVPGQLPLYFDPQVSLLFARMIKAMRLTEEQYWISSVKINDKSIFEIFTSEILLLKPELIISLGAQATNILMESTSRLKDTHGELFDVQLQDEQQQQHTLKLMPLFSPKLLQTAPNMKKTAWLDMQNAMEFLKL